MEGKAKELYFSVGSLVMAFLLISGHVAFTINQVFVFRATPKSIVATFNETRNVVGNLTITQGGYSLQKTMCSLLHNETAGSTPRFEWIGVMPLTGDCFRQLDDWQNSTSSSPILTTLVSLSLVCIILNVFFSFCSCSSQPFEFVRVRNVIFIISRCALFGLLIFCGCVVSRVKWLGLPPDDQAPFPVMVFYCLFLLLSAIVCWLEATTVILSSSSSLTF